MPSSTVKIPKLSKEVEQWLNSNEESDDDCQLFDAPMLQRRCTNASASPNRKRYKTTADKILHSSNNQDADQALAVAREIVAASLVVPNIPNASYLKWHVYKKGSCLPCILLDNKKEQAECLNIHLTARRDTLIEYIGYKHAHRGKCAAVSKSQLESIHEVTDRSTCSATHLKQFLACIKSQKAFKETQELLIEQHVVQCILEKVLRQQHILESTADSTSKTPESTALIEPSDCSGNLGNDQHETFPINEQGDSDVPKYNSEPAHTMALTEKESTAGSIITQSDSRSNTAGRRLLRARHDRPVQDEHVIRRLRAGDVVEYHDPIKVADRNTLRVATIIECLPRSSYLALRLDDGQILSRDDAIRVKQQLLRGKLKDVHCKKLVPISNFDLIRPKPTDACSVVEEQPQHSLRANAIWKAGVQAANDIVREAFAESDDDEDDNNGNNLTAKKNKVTDRLQKRTRPKDFGARARKIRRQTMA